MPPLLASRPWQVGLLVAASLLGASGFLPLFGGPGYEAALAAGLVLPAVAAVATALETARFGPSPYVALSRGLGGGLLLSLAGLVLAWLHGLRLGFCDPLGGTLIYLLGGGFGALMGGAWGAVAGMAARLLSRRRGLVAVTLALLGPAAGVGVSLWRFYTSAMVFAFDPFFGVFSGPLYDTVVQRTRELVTYRAGSLMTLVALGVLAASFERVGENQLRSRRLPWLVWLGGGAAALGSLGITFGGPWLGHYTTPDSLRHALGRQVVVGRCDIVHDRSILARDALALGRDCESELRELGAYLGVPVSNRVTVFLFASSVQKGRLTGAAHTQIAKPWRREVYLGQAGYPHPVLRHELAHVAAGALGRGPFRVAGPLGAWMPDPGRIEGVAMAASPDEGDLTLAEEARAMLDLGLLPSLEPVFRLSFLGENSSKAYAIAGAFVAWLHDQYGREVVGRWYGGTALATLTGGKPLAVLEREWKASLARVTLPPGALEAARLRFDRPAIFGRRCPRIVDELEAEAASRLAVGDHQDARAAFERLLGLDPGHVSARLGLATCALRAGSEAEARQRLTELEHDSALRVLDRARAKEMLGDLDFTEAHAERADRAYRELLEVTVSADRRRQLELKRSVVADPLGRRAVAALLVGDPRLGTSFPVAAAWLGEWSRARPDLGTADYLLGRNLFQLGRWRDGAEHLDRALERALPLTSIEREALRFRLVVACAEQDPKLALAVYTRVTSLGGLTPSFRQGIEALRGRCVTR